MNQLNVIDVEDARDPRIAPYLNIRERDLVGRAGHFIAEGEVVLRVLAATPRHKVLSVLIVDRRLEALAPLLGALPQGTPVYAVRQNILDEIAGFSIHRGILALGQRAPMPTVQSLLGDLGDDALVVGLYAIANHDNMGGILRNAAAFGVCAVLLDAQCCDPLYRKAIRVSVGGALKVPLARAAPGEDLAGLLKAHGFEVCALSPSGAQSLASLERARKMAVLLGAEGPGLPPSVLANARTVSIAMAGGFDSLNVATTSGIVLHRLTQRRADHTSPLAIA